MRCWRKIQLPAVGVLLVLGATVLAVTTPSAIELQADREARFEVGKQIAAKHPGLLTAWQKVAAAADPVNAAQADVNKFLAQQNALAGPLQEAMKNINDLQKTRVQSNGVNYVTPAVLEMLNQWRKKLDDLNAQSKVVDDRLSTARQALTEAQAAYTQASQEYAGQLHDYQQEYDKLFQEEYPRRLKALQDQAKDSQARLSQVFIVESLLPGEYTWSENAKDLGKVTITADNKITGVPPGARAGTWQVTAEGLVVTVGAETWLFKPGPMFALMGSNKGTAKSVTVRQALLRPTVPPDQAAYNAALQKLKDAAKQAAAAQAPSAAAQPGQPGAVQPGQPAAAQPGQPGAVQPGQPAAAQPGQPAAAQPGQPAAAQPEQPAKSAQTPVSLKPPYPGPDPDHIALQIAVVELAKQAGLGYDYDTSYKNTNPVCRSMVTPSIQNVPFADAMQTLLDPAGLAYDVVNNQVVLRKK